MRSPGKNIKTGILLVVCAAILLLPVPPEAAVLFGKDYQQTLHQHLLRAKTSIIVVMYFIILEPSGSGPVNELVNDLVSAQNRGVAVTVILENSKLKESRSAYQKLKENNIAVYFDTPAHLLHIKGVAVDDRYTFIGSANWTRAAIEKKLRSHSFCGFQAGCHCVQAIR